VGRRQDLALPSPWGAVRLRPPAGSVIGGGLLLLG
jgi:hypothetical protein